MKTDEPIHARLAPSSASRWSACTASVKFIEDNASLLPKQDWSYADEGTNAHSLAAAMIAAYPQGVVVPEGTPAEMVVYAREYVAFVMSTVDPGDKLYIERRVPLFYAPDQRGTLDVGIRKPDSLYIIDLKYGAGVSVEARENKQLAIYAESFIRGLEMIDDVPDDMLVTLCIYQPRDRNNPNPIRIWPVKRKTLADFCQTITAAAQDIDAGRIQFSAHPDVQCRFCPATGICKEYAAHVLGVIPEVNPFVSMPEVAVRLPDPAAITREQRCKVIAMSDGLLAWMKAVEAQEVSELSNGAEPLLFKLVAGKSNRRWTDEVKVEKLLRNYLPADKVRPPGDIISPAQAEKLLKAEDTSTKFENKFASLIDKPEGKPTLATLADKRPALEMNPLKALENLDVI